MLCLTKIIDLKRYAPPESKKQLTESLLNDEDNEFQAAPKNYAKKRLRMIRLHEVIVIVSCILAILVCILAIMYVTFNISFAKEETYVLIFIVVEAFHLSHSMIYGIVVLEQHMFERIRYRFLNQSSFVALILYIILFIFGIYYRSLTNIVTSFFVYVAYMVVFTVTYHKLGGIQRTVRYILLVVMLVVIKLADDVNALLIVCTILMCAFQVTTIFDVRKIEIRFDRRMLDNLDTIVKANSSKIPLETDEQN